MKRLTKIFLAIIIAAVTVLLSVNASGKIEAYLKFYGENKAYCDDIRNDIPLGKSEKAKERIFALTDNLTSFALSFHGEKAFSDMPSVLSDIERAEKHCKDTIETEIYFCNESIKENKVKKEYVDKGYIALRTDREANVIYEGKYFFAETDEEKIKEENEKYLEERINNIKKSSITYSKLSAYVQKLENTEYAVYDGKGNLLITSSEERTSEEAKEYFRSKKDHIILWTENRDKHASFSEGFTFLANGFEFPEAEEDYLLFISFDEKLDFDGSLKEADGFYKDTEARLSKYTDEMRNSLLLCALTLAVTFIAAMFISLPKSRKSAFLAFHLCLGVLVLSIVMTVFDSKTVIDVLASADPVKLSASLSAKAVKIFVPLMFLSAEGLIVSLVSLVKSKR